MIDYERKIALSAGTIEYTDCFSAKEERPPNECPDMTLSKLMVRFQ